MRNKFYRPKTSGFSLIEVLASLALVGTLLVTVLIAHRRNTHQILLAQNRLMAIDVLDRLLKASLSSSKSSDDDFKVDLGLGAGRVPGDQYLRWRATEKFDRAAEAVGALILRIEVFSTKDDNHEALAAVEILSASERRGVSR